MVDFTPFFVSFKLAFITTIVLFFVMLPIGLEISQSESKFKPFIESICALPLVLPPTVIGFISFLHFQKPHISEGFWISIWGLFVFSFEGLIFASCLYSLPFMFQPLLSGFESLNKNIIEASYLCGKSKTTTLFKVVSKQHQNHRF